MTPTELDVVFAPQVKGKGQWREIRAPNLGEPVYGGVRTRIFLELPQLINHGFFEVSRKRGSIAGRKVKPCKGYKWADWNRLFAKCTYE